MFEDFSKKFTVQHRSPKKEYVDHVPMLVYLEHSGNNSILHFVIWAYDLSLDANAEFEADVAARVFKNLDEEQAQKQYDALLFDFVEQVASFNAESSNDDEPE